MTAKEKRRITHKVCCRCGKKKPVSAFAYQTSRDGIMRPRGRCKSCQDIPAGQIKKEARKEFKKLGLAKVLSMGGQKFADHFWKRVKKIRGCWNWTGFVGHGGYGAVSMSGIPNKNFGCVNQSAPRVAYTLTYGPIPKGKMICHKCNNPRCCNPAHLYAGTAQTNIEDAIRAGNIAKGDKNGMRIWRTKEKEPRRGTTRRIGTTSHAAKLNERDVRIILQCYVSGRFSQLELAAKFDVSNSVIYSIVHRKTWKHVFFADEHLLPQVGHGRLAALQPMFAAEYVGGMTPRDIGELHNCSATSVTKQLKKAGVKLRTPKEVRELSDKLGRISKGKYGAICHSWKGGRTTDHAQGVIVMMREHPRAWKTGYVYEHVLVMENHIGRYLYPEETVKHRDGDRRNNHIDNLILMTRSEYQRSRSVAWQNVDEIVRLYLEEHVSARQIAKRFGTSAQAVTGVLKARKVKTPGIRGGRNERKSKFLGIIMPTKPGAKYGFAVTHKGKRHAQVKFLSEHMAARARDELIKKNGWPHPLNFPNKKRRRKR